MDISGVDYPEREKRFEVVYHLLSVRYGGRIRVKTYAGEADPVPSAIEVFRGADWYLSFSPSLVPANPVSGMSAKLGISLESYSLAIPICESLSPGMIDPFVDDKSRRILTDYGFEGHPLRKDFPLTVTILPSIKLI